MARKGTKLSQMDVCYVPEFSRPIVPLTDIYRLRIVLEIKKSFLEKFWKIEIFKFLIFADGISLEWYVSRIWIHI